MKTISVADLKSHLSEQIRATANGEEIVITSHGHPVAKLTAYQPATGLVIQRPTLPIERLRAIRGVKPLKPIDPVELLMEDRLAR